MLSHTAETAHLGIRNREDFDRFCASIADGLHALAQPLTILSSSIAAASNVGITQERQRYYLDISKSQVERACELFESLQQLAISADTRPSVERELP